MTSSSGLVASEIPTEVAFSEDDQATQAADRLRSDSNSSAKPQEVPASQNTATEHLPEFAIVNSQSDSTPTQDDDTLKQAAKDLHEAIFRTQFFGIKDDSDEEKIRHILEPMSAADRLRLEQLYKETFDPNGPAGTLRSDFQKRLSEKDWREMEAILNRHDDRTNDAGALMLALSQAKSDPEKGSAAILAVFRTLNSDDIAKLDQDFKAQYGKTYKEALAETRNVSQSTKDAVAILEKGSDKRSADDNIRLANLAVTAMDQRLYAVAVSGQSEAAKEARRILQADEAFKQKLLLAFPSQAAIERDQSTNQGLANLTFEQSIDPVVLDYFRNGVISLATITDANSGPWLFGNKANIELAARNATEEERKNFKIGRDLALSGKAPSEVEKNALEFYKRIHRAFNDAGSERETAIWEDQLLHGRATIITEMARTHADGHGPFDWGVGHSNDDIFKAVENLSKEDWELLRSANGSAFRKDIEDSLKLFTEPEEREALLKIIDDKAKQENYDKAKTVQRSITQTIADNTSSAFLIFGTKHDSKDIVEALSKLSPEDAQKYKENPEFRSSIDQFVQEKLKSAEQIYANRLLERIAVTGTVPEADALDKFLLGKINEVATTDSLIDIEKALHDEKLRNRLNLPDNQLTLNELRLKDLIKETVFSAFRTTAPGNDGLLPQDRYLKELYEKGRLSLQSKVELNVSKKSLIETAAIAPEKERQGIRQIFSQAEWQIVEAVEKNGGNFELADNLRLYILTGNGNYRDFEKNLKDLTDSQKQDLKDIYSDRYKSTLNDDFLKQIKDVGEKAVFKQYLTPTEVDPRQQYYDKHNQILASMGVVLDGTGLTLARAGELTANALTHYQSQFQKLPPEQQAALNAYFGEALEQHKQSKEKLAEILIDATITAASLAASPFTAGMSAAALASFIASSAVVGGAYRVAIMKAMQGSDFDTSAENIIKQLVNGGVNTVLNLVGPEVIGLNQLSSLAAHVAANAVIGAGSSVIAEVSATVMAGGEIDWTSVLKSAGVAFATGGIVPVAIHVGGIGARKVIVNMQKSGDDLVALSDGLTEPITFKNSQTGEEITLAPGSVKTVRVNSDWRVSGDGAQTPPSAPTAAAPAEPILFPQITATHPAYAAAYPVEQSDVPLPQKPEPVTPPSAFGYPIKPGDNIRPPQKPHPATLPPASGYTVKPSVNNHIPQKPELYERPQTDFEPPELDTTLQFRPGPGDRLPAPAHTGPQETASGPVPPPLPKTTSVRANNILLPPGQLVTVGRGRRANVVINGDPHVSREHAKLYTNQKGEFFISDMASQNGVFVNSNRITSGTIDNPHWVKLAPSDYVTLGPYSHLDLAARTTLLHRGDPVKYSGESYIISDIDKESNIFLMRQNPRIEPAPEMLVSEDELKNSYSMVWLGNQPRYKDNRGNLYFYTVSNGKPHLVQDSNYLALPPQRHFELTPGVHESHAASVFGLRENDPVKLDGLWYRVEHVNEPNGRAVLRLTSTPETKQFAVSQADLDQGYTAYQFQSKTLYRNPSGQSFKLTDIDGRKFLNSIEGQVDRIEVSQKDLDQSYTAYRFQSRTLYRNSSGQSFELKEIDGRKHLVSIAGRVDDKTFLAWLSPKTVSTNELSSNYTREIIGGNPYYRDSMGRYFEFEVHNGQTLMWQDFDLSEFNLQELQNAELPTFPLHVRNRLGEDFDLQLRKALLELPPRERAFLAKHGIEMAAGNNIVNVDPSLRGGYPGGHPGGSTWENVAGIATFGNRRAIIGETFVDQNTGKSIATKDVFPVDVVVKHELGHAIDFVKGISNDWKFQEVYDYDLANAILTPAERIELDYYLQPNDRAAAFAETFAQLYAYSRGLNSRAADRTMMLLVSAFPETLKYINEILETLE